MAAAFPLVLSSPAEAGPLVEQAQRALAQNKYGDFYDARIDGVYGEYTAQATYRAKHYLGYEAAHLRQSGHAFGPDLLRLLEDEAQLSAAQARRRKARVAAAKRKPKPADVLRVAIGQIGVKESPAGSNDVKYIRWWGKLEWGATVRFAWCYVFVTWCHVQAGFKALDPQAPGPRGGRHRYCPYGVADARAGANGMALVSAAGVQPGHIVHFDWDGGVSDHVGIFERWLVPGRTFTAIEGNTAVGNDSNGGQVMRRERSMAQVECFAKVTR